MSIISITKETFQKEVLEATLPVLADFWAPWCGPCRMVAPLMEELSEELKGKAVFVKINVDEEIVLSQRYGIMSIPTIIVFSGGKAVDKKIGACGKAELRKMLDSAKMC
ncbi:MAG: thioredoxin [Saccharofermentanales bacterium]